MTTTRRPGLASAAGLALSCAPAFAAAQGSPLRFGVGLFQPDKERNDATYRPLAEHLAARMGRSVTLRTVDTWEGLAKSLASGETDIALLGPWGYVLAHQSAGAQVVGTILHDGKPEYQRAHRHPSRVRPHKRRRAHRQRQDAQLCLWRQGLDFGLPDPAALFHAARCE